MTAQPDKKGEFISTTKADEELMTEYLLKINFVLEEGKIKGLKFPAAVNVLARVLGNSLATAYGDESKREVAFKTFTEQARRYSKQWSKHLAKRKEEIRKKMN